MYLIDVAYRDCREVDLIQTLCGRMYGGHHGAAVEIRSSSEDKEGCNHYGCAHYHHPDVSPGGVTSKNIP